MFNQPMRLSMSRFIKNQAGSQFIIPVYQRRYTWRPEIETAAFLNNIEEILTKQKSEHFLGIVIYMQAGTSYFHKQLQLVDGQQRMTTAFLFLTALRDQSDPSFRKKIDKDYLYTGANALRLKTAQDGEDVFARLVYGSEKDLSSNERETNIFLSYQKISEWIRTQLKSSSVEEILKAFAQMDILAFPLQEGDDTQQIFESINSTGAPLTSADLIRNYILMDHQDEEQERLYKMYWKPLEREFASSRLLEEFFRFYLAVKTFGLLNRRNIYAGFKAYWKQIQNHEKAMQEINQYCQYYSMIYKGHFSDPEVEEAFADFRMTSSLLPAPFLMEMVHLYEEKEITDQELISIVRLLDSYLVRRSLCGMDISSLNRYFPALLKNVLLSMNESDVVTALRANLIDANRGRFAAMPADDQVRSQLRTINAYSSLLIRQVLERLEYNGASARVDLRALNIEHIMPQNPNAYWKKNSGAADEEEYSQLVNLIGNLTLCAVSDNTKIGNEDFQYKKKILQETLHIRLNTEILQKKQWNKKEILMRTDKMADQILTIWPYRISTHEKGIQKKTKRMNPITDTIVTLNAPTVSAHALIHNNGKTEVQAGTMMKAYGPNEMKKMRTLFAALIDQGVLSENKDGRIQFTQSYTFANANEAARFLLHRGGDNEAAWHAEGRNRKPKAKKETAENRKAKAEKKDARPAKSTPKHEHAGKENRQTPKKTPEKAASQKQNRNEKDSRKTAVPKNNNNQKKQKNQSASAAAKKETHAKQNNPKHNKKQNAEKKSASASNSNKSKRRDPRNPRGIKPQGTAAVKAAQEVQAPFVRFAGMGQGPKHHF